MNLNAKLGNLPLPTIVEENDFETLFIENIEEAKKVLGENWQPLESDPYTQNIRLLTLRQMHNQAGLNHTIKQMLVTLATGVDLDYLGLERGIIRDEGEYPYADFEFTLYTALDYNVTIPKGTLLNDVTDSIHAYTSSDAVILEGELSVVVRVELEIFSFSSDLKTENIVTSLPFAPTVKQLESYSDGAALEDDERYRMRIILSRKFSTAGSADAYRYFALSADARIADVFITSEASLEVHIYLASDVDIDDLMIERVYTICNAKSVRPLSDKVVVSTALVRELSISITITVFDLLKSGEIEEKIRNSFKYGFALGQDLVKSEILRKCHLNGVYKVESDFVDVVVEQKEIIKIISLTLAFEEM
jgi:phage-related baseplate assembly protein